MDKYKINIIQIFIWTTNSKTLRNKKQNKMVTNVTKLNTQAVYKKISAL